MKCKHLNFISIFNSDRGCAYCPDCGKSPLSAHDCGVALLAPGFDKMAESIAKDIAIEILSKPPSPMDDLQNTITTLVSLSRDYPYLRTEDVAEWVNDAHRLLAEIQKR